jgi:transposase-like protein
VIGEHYVDMLQASIIDPAKVTRLAVENAARDIGCCRRRIRVWRRRFLDDGRSGLADRLRGTTADLPERRRAGGEGPSVPYRTPGMRPSLTMSTIETTTRGSSG